MREERPILFYPDGRDRSEIPQGWQPLTIDGVRHEGNFVKVALNVVRLPGSQENRLPSILRGWFGADCRTSWNESAGCLREWRRWPSASSDRSARLGCGPAFFDDIRESRYRDLFGDQFNPATWNAGFVVITPREPKHVCLLVTLNKGDMGREFQYGDRFLSGDLFQWQSQNRNRRESAHGQLIRDHVASGVQVHLFVRGGQEEGGRGGSVHLLRTCHVCRVGRRCADHGALAPRKWRSRAHVG